jgi:twitching motility protein PilT
MPTTAPDSGLSWNCSCNGEQGMQTLEKALANLVMDGSISQNEAMAKAGKPGELARLIETT